MGGEKVELIWYGLCLIKAAIFLVTFLPVALLCKWLLRRVSSEKCSTASDSTRNHALSRHPAASSELRCVAA